MSEAPSEQQQSTRGPRVGRLSTASDVIREMGKVYRETRRGQLRGEDGARLVWMLGQLRAAIEVSDIEARIEHLEAEERRRDASA